MRSSEKGAIGPGEEWFDGIIKLVAAWGAALAIGEGINRLLTEVLSRGWRVGLSLLAVYLVLLTIFWGGEKWPRLRDGFLAWRYPIAILLAVYAGYQWHAHDYARSREGRLSEATRAACERIPGCKKAAEDWLSFGTYYDE